MRGIVSSFDAANGRGIIDADNGKTYPFIKDDLGVGADGLAAGDVVNFNIDNNQATYISLDQTYRYQEKSRIIAALLAFSFGVIGLHKFYLGNTKAGFIHCLLTLITFLSTTIFILLAAATAYISNQVSFVILIIIPFIASVPMLILVVTFVTPLIEGFIYLCKTEEQFDTIYVKGDRAWF